MKKLLVAAVAIAASSPLVASAENFTGAYAGVGLGLNSLSTGYRQSTSTSQTAVRSNTGGNLFNSALFGGYGKTFGQFYVGGELTLSYTNGNVKSSSMFAGVSDTTKIQSTWSVSPAVRLGALIAPKTLAYVKLGAVDTQFKVNAAQLGGTSTTSYKKNLWGFSTGAGIETLVTEKISVRADYTFNLYSKKTFGVGDAPQDNAKISPRENIFRVGLAYNF